MIHQYKLGGFNVVLDVCSGSVHVVDEVAYDIIAMFEQNDRKVISSYFKRLQEIRTIIAPEFMKTIQELNRKIEKPSQNTILIKLAK